MEIKPIAHFESPLKSKFGIPRQSGLVSELTGRIVFEPAYRKSEAVRGLEEFDFLWLIWEFSGNKEVSQGLTVRPPRLGGNTRLGVFATRSPFRPNPLGLSCVRIDKVVQDANLGPVIYVKGADLMDGTPIYDIKPYIPYTDCISEAYTSIYPKPETLDNVIYNCKISQTIDNKTLKALEEILLQDPRPAYKKEDTGIYKFEFGELHVEFYVNGKTVFITSLACCNSSLLKSLTPSNG